MRTKGTLAAAVLLCLGGCGGEDDLNRPIASFTVNCDDFICEFDATNSSSPIGLSLQYRWDFGDGTGGFGDNIIHAFEEGGSYEVELVVLDGRGISGTQVQSITATDDETAGYYTPIRRSLASFLLVAESGPSLAASGDWIQDQVETQGPPDEDGYSLDCLDTGTASVETWEDADASTVIDNGETVYVIPRGCETGETSLVNSLSEIGFQDDFDTSSFAIVMPVDAGYGIATEFYENWFIRGTLSMAATRSSGEIATLDIDAPDIQLLYRPSDGLSTLNITGGLSVSRDVPAFTGVSGNLMIRYGTGATAPDLNLNVTSPLDFQESGDELSISAGSFTVTGDDFHADISVDADPDYLLVEVDTNADGVIDLTGRYPQRLTIERFID